MSKGNLFLGYGRGSIGDVTFSRNKGQQVARARNRKPANPRTQKQMTQRSIFMSAVKFFSRGVQNLFQFAFEDKTQNESDYNCFMRHNAKSGIYMTKDNFDNQRYPAIGNWLMTNGSLSAFDCSLAEISGELFLNGATRAYTTSASPRATIGDITNILIANQGWQVGDIVTCLVINTTAAPGTGSDPINVGTTNPEWIIHQFILDPSNATLLNDVDLDAKIDENGQLILYPLDYMAKIAGGCFIHSRNTADGTKVSTQNLVNTAQTTAAIEKGTSAAWLSEVLADWSAREAAILQGSLASSN